jgi:hypothetical protein
MILESKTKFAPHPETDGPIRAVVVDVTDPKKTVTKFGEKEKFAIVYETELKREDGSPWTHWAHGYTPSLNEKATLRKDIVKITGEAPGEKFDTESLIGKPVKLIIEHKTTDDETYANITYLKQDTGPDALKPSGKYIRQRDKKKDDANNTGAAYNRTDVPEQPKGWQQTKVHVGKFAGQELENLDESAIKALIQHWIPDTQVAGYRITADDKRLLAALDEVQKLLAGAGGVPVEAKF